ncbi:MAG: type III PLP-dependent enzyme [Alphaproteobacteria bacterium]|nr:type III PLP-dependent enzyme [Alphaproteobacteria bacterium]
MNDRFKKFLDVQQPESPCLLLDLDIVRLNYESFAESLPDTQVFYAVKANPAPEVLNLLYELGSSFDCASMGEIELVLATGAGPDRISFGNTIKKKRDIERAFQLGICLFAVDCDAEVEKVAQVAAGSKIFCRVLCDGTGSSWPLSNKFGCDSVMAVDVLEYAHTLGLQVEGVSFHVGSQQADPGAWDHALAIAASVFRTLAQRGIQLKMINLGGGFPACRLHHVPDKETYGRAIFSSLRTHFGNCIPETIIEPGRGMVADAGLIKAEVVLISKKTKLDTRRWVYLDIGKFGGLAETMSESIRYPIRTPRDNCEKAPVVLAGPTCDSVDVLYEKTPFMLPVSLQIGDEVLIEATGAYTMTYASNHFNGIPPLAYFVI